jgi:hypothetical protein
MTCRELASTRRLDLMNRRADLTHSSQSRFNHCTT